MWVIIHIIIQLIISQSTSVMYPRQHLSWTRVQNKRGHRGKDAWRVKLVILNDLPSLYKPTSLHKPFTFHHFSLSTNHTLLFYSLSLSTVANFIIVCPFWVLCVTGVYGIWLFTAANDFEVTIGVTFLGFWAVFAVRLSSVCVCVCVWVDLCCLSFWLWFLVDLGFYLWVLLSDFYSDVVLVEFASWSDLLEYLVLLLVLLFVFVFMNVFWVLSISKW